MTELSLKTPARDNRSTAGRDVAPAADAVAALADYRVETDAVAPRQWEDIVDLFADATYDQTATFSGHGWGDGRLSNLVLYKGERIVAAAQIVILKIPALPRGLAYVKFGPLWRRKGAAADTSDLSAVLQALQREYAGRRGHMLTVLPPPDPDYLPDWSILLPRTGFQQRRDMADPNRYLVDLSLDHDAQRASLAQKWRYNLNKSAKNELRIVAGRDDADLEAFARLYGEMLARKGFSDGGAFDAVAKMIERLPGAMRPEIVLGYHDEAATVGAVVGRIGDVSQYLFGATDDRALALRAGYALQWHILEQQKDAGGKWYDLGGEANADGLRQFKKGLVGKKGRIVVLLGEWDYWSDPIGRFAADAMFAVRSARASLRRLLDRNGSD